MVVWCITPGSWALVTLYPLEYQTGGLTFPVEEITPKEHERRRILGPGGVANLKRPVLLCVRPALAYEAVVLGVVNGSTVK